MTTSDDRRQSDLSSSIRVADLLAHVIGSRQTAQGGWAMHSGGPANTEATAFATMALAAASTTSGAVVADGISWLLQQQCPDGGWPVSSQVPDSTWTTAPAVLALALLDGHEDAIARGTGWLVNRTAATEPWGAWFVRRVTGTANRRAINDLDPSIPGWPWADATASWVEPTAMAMLALRAAAARTRTAREQKTARRIEDGVRLLFDRAVPTGGWNYGNRRVLGQDLDAYPDTTAWALLALHAADAGGHPAVSSGLRSLDLLMRNNRSPLARSLNVLALRTHGRDTHELTVLLAAQCAGQYGDVPPSDTRSCALALLALAGPSVPFEVA